MFKLSLESLSIWAKKTVRDNKELWLPLIAHLIDTMNVIDWLYHHWLSSGQRKLLAKAIGRKTSENLVKFLGFSHDLGKACASFEAEASYVKSKKLDHDLNEKLRKSGFTDFNPSKIKDISKTPHNLTGEVILEYLGLNETVGAIIGGHHGKPLDEKQVKYKDSDLSEEDESLVKIKTYLSNYWFSLNDEKDWLNVQKELVNYGLRLSGFKSIKDIPEVTQPQAVILEGLVIMADWIASSEYLNNEKDKPMFTLISLKKGFYDLNMEERFKKAISTFQQNSEWKAETEENVSNLYFQRFGFYPRPVQEKMSEAIANSNDPGIIIVEAPMGIGKTEIALTGVEQLSYKTGRNGLFFGLPTQATSNAMFDRVNQWLHKVADSGHLKLFIGLLHSKAQFNDHFMKLPNAEDIDNKSSVTINDWFTGKKTILIPFSVGTIDQLLLMGLKQRHLFLKHLGLSNKVVVIDEVHAYDIYMYSYLEKAINWLGAYHVPVIALSATLPEAKRRDLVEAYITGKYGNADKLEAEDDWTKNEAYPLLTFTDGKKLNQVSDFSISKKDEQKVGIVRLNYSDEELIQKVEQKISDGGVAEIIVNTVKRAQKLAKLVDHDIPVLVLHSMFLAPDRLNKEKQLQKLIGKNAKRPRKLVVIGTQVLEQSLDTSADVMYTDIAPIDLIIQRMGRLHRHKTVRPKKLIKPQLYVLGATSYGNYKSAEAIYSKYILMKTDYFLPKIIKIPEDISVLVQKVYDKNTDKEVANIGSAKKEYDNKKRKQEEKASTFQIQAPDLSKEATIHGWLDSEKPDVDKDQAMAEASVRDIKASLEVIILKHTSDGYFLVTKPCKNIKDVSKKEIAQQVIRLPAALMSNMKNTVNKLEENTKKYFPEWANNVWLRHAFVVLLNENCDGEINGWRIHYSSEFGLEYRKTR